VISHAEIEQFLSENFPARSPNDGLRLVARYADPGLSLPAGRARIFIPDLHLLSEEAAKQFPNTGFRLEASLTRFLRALAAFKELHPGDLQVFQIGDLFDIWRIKGPGGPKRKVDTITADHGELLSLLLFGPPMGLRASLLAGNHDYDLHNLAEWNTPRFWFLNDSPAGVADALLIHGDCLDWLENFVPDSIQEAAVQLAKFASAGQHELDHEDLLGVLAVNDGLPRGDTPIGVARAEFGSTDAAPEVRFNVVPWTRNVGDVGRYFDGARRMALALRERGRDIRLVICGHSHNARIVIGDRGDGVPFALMDCGAWLGQCRFGQNSPWRANAQVGVLIDDDARIYQLL
jgi:UDP-2,3-diacylglucosamine pyrophosphatase LpxH